MQMPAIFFGHGNPLNAIQRNVYTEGWAAIGNSLPRPRAILCISAHWYFPATAVTAMPAPRTIHDFGGFPRELYQVQYPAPGSPPLAARVRELLAPVSVTLDETRPAQFHYDLAKRLSPLRDEGVLIVGSGNIVHNLHTYAWGTHEVEPFDWAVRFEKQAREFLLKADDAPLITYESLGRDALLSVPTPEHYLPLIYVMALRRENDEVTFPIEGFDGGSISMLTVRIG